MRENILHSARIRLPSTWKEPEIRAHVDALLKCLNLDHVQHSLVGDPMKPVISGGQRKRVSIGIELAAAPVRYKISSEVAKNLRATVPINVPRKWGLQRSSRASTLFYLHFTARLSGEPKQPLLGSFLNSACPSRD